MNVSVSVDPPIISDHSVISATVVFDQTVMGQLSSACIGRRWTDFDIESFKNDLLKSELICCPPGNFEEFFATYDRHYQSCWKNMLHVFVQFVRNESYHPGLTVNVVR